MNPKMSSKFEALKKTVTEAGMTAIGEGARVEFRHRVEDLMKRSRLSKEQAEKKELSHALQGLYHETLKGMISLDSKEYKNFISGLVEIIGPQGLTLCRETGYKGDIRTISTGKIASLDVDKISDYYHRKMSAVPIHAVLYDTASEVKQMQQLALRAGREIFSYTSSKDTLEKIFSLHPGLKIDIGRIIICKEGIERHEKEHTNRLVYEASVKQLKQTAKETLAETAARAPADFFRKIHALPTDGKGIDAKKLIKGVGYAGELIGRELKACGKLSIEFLKTLYRFGKTQK